MYVESWQPLYFVDYMYLLTILWFLSFFQVPNYYKIITNPIDFSKIKIKLQRQNFNHYDTIEDFIADVKLVFQNCATYNSVSNSPTVLIFFSIIDFHWKCDIELFPLMQFLLVCLILYFIFHMVIQGEITILVAYR